MATAGQEQCSTEFQSNLGLHWFCFIAHCEWSKKTCSTLSANQMQHCKLLRLGHSRFHALKLFKCIHFEFAMALLDIYLCSY